MRDRLDERIDHLGKTHPAGLNFGACASYALARETGEPLLFKGGDFGRTDIDPAATRDGTGWTLAAVADAIDDGMPTA